MPEIAVTEKSVSAFIAGNEKSLAAFLPAGARSSDMSAGVMLAILQSDDLKACLTTEPGRLSLIQAMRVAYSRGLSLNPAEGKAALIGYSGKVQYQIMVGGMKDIAMKTGLVKNTRTGVNYQGDVFTIRETSAGDSYERVPGPGGTVVESFYASLTLKDGTSYVLMWPLDRVKAHKEKYSSRTKMDLPGYGQKTVLKALLKSIGLPEIDEALEAAEISETFDVDDTVTHQHGTSADDLTQTLTVMENAGFEVISDEPAKPAPVAPAKPVTAPQRQDLF